jgi:DNA-binding NtrC family response regulator
VKCGRILLVDDDRVAARATRRQLETLGHSVLAVIEPSAELSAALDEHAPDLLLVNARRCGERAAMRMAVQAQEQSGTPTILQCSAAQRRTADRARQASRPTPVLRATDAQALPGVIQIALYRSLFEREQKRAAEQNTRATEAEAVIRTTVRLVHQLNNMLSAIRCNAFLIQTESQVNPELIEAARDITIAVERGAELMTQVTALAREHSAEAGRLDAQIAELLRADDSGKRAASRGRPGRAKSDTQRSVLVVDDDQVVHRAVTRFLTNRGYRILAAASPREALSLAEQEPIDVMITDLIMPEMTGYDLAARIQKLRPGVRVIYMSGYAARPFASGTEPVQASAAPLLQKPFAVETLLHLLSSALGPGDAPTARVAAGTASASNDP